MKTKGYRILGIAILAVSFAFFASNTYSQRIKPLINANEKPASLFSIDYDSEYVQLNSRLSSVVTHITSDGINVSFNNPTSREVIVTVYDHDNNVIKEHFFPPTKEMIKTNIKVRNSRMIKHVDVRLEG